MVENKDELSSSTFKPSMWTKIVEEIRTRTGVNFTISQLSTKYQRLRIEWVKYHWLLKQTGLGVDPMSREIQATKEQWKALEGMQEGMVKFQKGGLPFYEELTQLFNRSTATGICSVLVVLQPQIPMRRGNCKKTLVGDSFVSNSSAFAQYRDTAPSHSTEPSKNSVKRKKSGISPESMDGSCKKSKGASTVEMLTQLWAVKELSKTAKKGFL